MGYQALLFCPEEKLARVVSQVFSELDFTIDPVHEPFAAVKQLMAQRYDAIVVDCDNEQNASLLFRSARNSSCNQSSLAFALVEGQTGVAKAYRIGANLVLTKPINLEQAKGTLRIARGLLRKNADSGASSANASALPRRTSPSVAASASATSVPAARIASAVAVSVPLGSNEFAPCTAAAVSAISAPIESAAMARVEEDAAVPAFPPAENRIMIAEATPESAGETPRRDAASTEQSNRGARENDVTQPVVGSEAARAVSQSSGSARSAGGSASAPSKGASISSAAVKEDKTPETKPGRRGAGATSTQRTAAPTAPVPIPRLNSLNASGAPSFGGLSREGFDGSARKRKILIAAVIVLALAALSYLSDGKLGKFGARRSPGPAATSPDSTQPTPSVKPMSAPAGSPSANPPGRASASNQSQVRETAVSGAKSTPSLSSNFESTSDSEIKPSRTAAISVKSHMARAQRQTYDDSAPPSPATLALASVSDTKLSNLMSAASLDLTQPQLATIKVSQGVSRGLLIKRVQPQYPSAALALHAHGTVQIEATISKEGNVINPKVLRGDPLLARFAIEAVRQWRYKPYYLDGDPVEIQTEITINFKTD